MRRGDGYVNLALLTDGLRAEREQGITIDVAYRSFVTPRRRFQLADAPGHVQYTRNMVTGASTADVAVILLDARKGVVEQTRRHAYIASILAIPHVVVAVNKMDLVDFSEERFREIEADLQALSSAPRAARTSARSRCRRCAATTSSTRGEEMPWYDGPDAARAPRDDRDRRRPQPRRPALPGAVGDPADVGRAPRLPRLRGRRSPAASGARATRSSCCPSGRAHARRGGRDARRPARGGDPADVGHDQARGRPRRRAAATCSPTPSAPPIVARELEAALLDERAAARAARAARRQAHDAHRARDRRGARLASSTCTRSRTCPRPAQLELNDIGVVRLRLAEPLVVDPYAANRATGAFILIDEATNDTVGAGMVRRAPRDLAVHARRALRRPPRRHDRHGRRLAHDADPRDRSSASSRRRRRHRHPPRRDLQVVRRPAAPAARQRARAA